MLRENHTVKGTSLKNETSYEIWKPNHIPQNDTSSFFLF